MTSEDERCTICGRALDVPGDELSVSCGGDCWGCVGEIEADGWGPSLLKVMDGSNRGLRPNWTPPVKQAEILKTESLWRPVGSEELALIRASGWLAFPPRLPDQPIFYSVLDEAYAIQIARDWNGPRGGGWVTQFDVLADYLKAFEVQQVDGRGHREYWIPAEVLPAFNSCIVGSIKVTAEFR